MNKKVLIFHPIIRERFGGPSTYLYNLKQFVLANNMSDQIYFLSDYIEPMSDNSVTHVTENKIKNLVKRFLCICIGEKIWQNIRMYKFIGNLKKGNTKISFSKEILINDFDYIHFHSALQLCLHRNMLKKFRGKIILTSHCPEIPHREYLHDGFGGMKLNEVWKINLKGFDWFEKIVFNKLSDYIIFPCKESIEPYYNTYPLFKIILSEQKIRYVPTGIMPAKHTISKTSIRSQYNIPDDEIILSYIGRHNSVKGYDILLEFGKEILNKYNNITFIVAGKEQPMKGLQHEKWIETGWTDDPYSIINASDMFVLPNKETYFDLILLEVISLGKPVLLSYTGGNKYFDKFTSKGLIFFENMNLHNMISVFDANFKNMHLWAEYGSVNKEIYDKHFNIDVFGNNYIQVINELP